MPVYEIIEHTADVGFRVFGRDRKDLFENAGRSFAEILVEHPPETGTDEREITLDGTDPEDLLVRYLGELLYIFHVEEQVAIDVTVSRITETELTAVIVLAPFDLDIHGQNHDVKAVTYHDIEIAETEEGLRAAVIFDI